MLTRGNRSVRFFDYLVDALAEGGQPDPHLVAVAGYMMRSTAFYANGKYGMRSFEGYSDDHRLRVPTGPSLRARGCSGSSAMTWSSIAPAPGAETPRLDSIVAGGGISGWATPSGWGSSRSRSSIRG